jgi:hypothetical protein
MNTLCGRKSHCFIAPHSKYFERACGGMFKEGAEREVKLKEDRWTWCISFYNSR